MFYVTKQGGILFISISKKISQVSPQKSRDTMADQPSHPTHQPSPQPVKLFFLGGTMAHWLTICLICSNPGKEWIVYLYEQESNHNIWIYEFTELIPPCDEGFWCLLARGDHIKKNFIPKFSPHVLSP